MSAHANRPHRPGRKDPKRPGMVVDTKEGIFRTTTFPFRKDRKTGEWAKVPNVRET